MSIDHRPLLRYKLVMAA